MLWNWQCADWPQFRWNEKGLDALDARFQHQAGLLVGAAKHLLAEEKTIFVVSLMTSEAVDTSEIEGDYLDRASIQSSIRNNFGLDKENRRIPPAERGIAAVMIDLFRHPASPLSHMMLYRWHKLLMGGRSDMTEIGRYRASSEPMRVISGSTHNPKVHFEAPPSRVVKKEMDRFIRFFEKSSPDGKAALPPLVRAGVAHLYFVSIHPFSDGNGRIARAISEKSLSQSLGEPTLIALSHTISRNRKRYYDALARNNKDTEITSWLRYFGEAILDAQRYSLAMIDFIIEKAKLYDRVRSQLNARQAKAVERVFREGLEGFKGGLSAENYIAITRTSRATATRDLHDLVQKKVLVRTGELKATRYYVNVKGRTIELI